MAAPASSLILGPKVQYWHSGSMSICMEPEAQYCICRSKNPFMGKVYLDPGCTQPLQRSSDLDPRKLSFPCPSVWAWSDLRSSLAQTMYKGNKVILICQTILIHWSGS